jgi:hypothetical protein
MSGRFFPAPASKHASDMNLKEQSVLFWYTANRAEWTSPGCAIFFWLKSLQITSNHFELVKKRISCPSAHLASNRPLVLF